MYSYSLPQFGGMIRDQVRMDAHLEALKRSVHPDSVVVDIGAGTGVFSLMACQCGARRVYAIDPNPWIELGRQIAAANGYADQIVFIRDLSTNVTLPERADVIISELRDAQPITAANLPTIRDARQRLLKPGGLLIPQRDIVYATLIASPQRYRKSVIDPWRENAYGLDMSAAFKYVVNTVQGAAQLEAVDPLLPPQVWVDIDYATHEDLNVSRRLEWVADGAATAHYVLLWFDAVLFDDIGFTSAPWLDHGKLYGYDLLPLERPLDIAPGDTITLDLTATLVQGQYIFGWNTIQRSAGTIKAAFQQSTFHSTLHPELRRLPKP